jgi:hypothetical protein
MSLVESGEWVAEAGRQRSGCRGRRGLVHLRFARWLVGWAWPPVTVRRQAQSSPCLRQLRMMGSRRCRDGRYSGQRDPPYTSSRGKQRNNRWANRKVARKSRDPRRTTERSKRSRNRRRGWIRDRSRWGYIRTNRGRRVDRKPSKSQPSRPHHHLQTAHRTRPRNPHRPNTGLRSDSGWLDRRTSH